MYTVDNHLYEASFGYDKENDKNYLGNRSDELIRLQDICEYCSGIGEKLQCDLDIFYETEIEPDVQMCNWLFSDSGFGDHDTRELLLRMLDMFTGYEGAGNDEIAISLGVFENCISTKKEYIDKRRGILAGLKNIEEFGHFMSSCFQNCIFADNIISAMGRIKDFKFHTKEIVYNLSLLNDDAAATYLGNNRNPIEAMKELSARALECTDDPGHKEYLRFPFTYSNENNENSGRIVEIECSPHMKLIRRDSNLRIYFYWYDDMVGDGEKVLIGRIGSHPYK